MGILRAIPALLCAGVLPILPAAASEPGDSHGHAHEAPHGGTLVALGQELAHLELVRDPEQGRLTLYVLDGAAERGVRLAQDRISARLQRRAEEGEPEEPLELELVGVANPLTGESQGDTSEFRTEHPALRTWERFDVHLPRLVVRGATFDDLRFPFPEGNEPRATPEDPREEPAEHEETTHEH